MFDKDSSLPTDDVNSRSNIWDVAIDVKDNFFLLTALEKPGTEKSCWVKRLANTADLYYRFCLKEEVDCIGLSVSDTWTILALKAPASMEEYGNDREFVCS